REQGGAEKHGRGPESAPKARPLLVIAGARSGKTKPLAHRVAHLVVSGVDPHRILLLTFTRRAADEMIRRVKRITAKVIGTQQVDLPWSGTFHARRHLLEQLQPLSAVADFGRGKAGGV